MKLGIVVNVMDSDEAGASTYRFAADAINMDHEVWVMSPGHLPYNPDDTIGAFARSVPQGRYTSVQFLNVLKGDKAINQWITLANLDVPLLRSHPSVQRGWAQSAGIHFGRLAMRHGVIVLNDPNGLSKAVNKLYLQTFPDRVRPMTLVTRHLGRIETFLDEEGTIIVQPLQGSDGAGVFIVRNDEERNLEDIFSSVSRAGYLIAQKFLPAAAEGDTTLYLMKRFPLRHKGSLRRVPPCPHGRQHPQQHARRRPTEPRGIGRHDARACRNSATALSRRRHVSDRTGHRGRQADADQRIQSGWIRQRSKV